MKVLSAQEKLFVTAMTSGETKGNATAAAKVAGYQKAKSSGHKLKNRPHVKHAIETIESTALVVAGKKLGRSLAKLEIIERLWELAQIAPKETNNNITGQIAACRLASELEEYLVHRHADVSEITKGRSEEEQEFFCKNGYFPEEDELHKEKPSTTRSESRSAGGVKPN